MSTSSVTPVPEAPVSASTPAVAPIAAFGGARRVPQPINDVHRTYAPGSPERAELKARLASMAAEKIEIPIIIGGREIRTGKTEKSVMPHNHQHVLAEYHLAGPEEVRRRSPPLRRRVANGRPGLGRIA